MINATGARVILLTIASAFLLAAGDSSSLKAEGFASVVDDSLLAPMSAADANAANAALTASLPADIALNVDAPNFAVTPDGTATDTDIANDIASGAPRPAKLAQLVNQVSATATVTGDTEMRCLANAVYFESRGEPLEGQLAVAQSILNRVESGRYASSICGVIAQRGQFSFDRSRSPAAGIDWRNAMGIARIAARDMWAEVAPKAVSFHAAHLSPAWRGKIRIAQIGNHIFYR
ncbi:MAG: cell wall hydrolase [Sandarakinorhabdus sp.]|nr:cell wall hydrolase [Sandarakinorhabdus sp.]